MARPLLDATGRPRFELWADLQLNGAFEGIAKILQVPELKSEWWILDARGQVISAPPRGGSRQQPFNLLQRFPMLRTPLAEGSSGRLLDSQGLVVYQALNPLQQDLNAAPGSGLGRGVRPVSLDWMLVMRVPPDQLQRGSLLASAQGQLLIGASTWRLLWPADFWPTASCRHDCARWMPIAMPRSSGASPAPIRSRGW